MALEKLKIEIENDSQKFNNPLEVLFNPNQIQYSPEGGELQDGQLVDRNQPATLSIQLFFDTTLTKPQSKLNNYLPTAYLTSLNSNVFTPEDVIKYTKPIFNLTLTNGKLNRPPRCKLMWGKGNYLLEQGFLRSITQTLTHFLEDGTPVRATLNCDFQEWQPGEFQEKIQNPVDDPTRIVRRGETLSSIAAEEYNDPSLWRVIAKENRIDNPRKLFSGQVLTVPPLPGS